MDSISPLSDAAIGARIKAQRLRMSMTLDDVSRQSGVSRAMISKVERGEVSASATLLVKLASALNLTLSSLFDEAGTKTPLSRRANQPEWRDPETGYLRRTVSPHGMGAPMDIVEVHLPAGARVAFDNCTPVTVHQFVWVLEGCLTMQAGDERYELSPGDCLHMRLDGPLVFHNETQEGVRYAVVVGSSWEPISSGGR